MKHIVKRHGEEEHYDSRKVYASVYAACRNAHSSEQKSENCADSVSGEIDRWIEKKDEVNSKDISKKAYEELKKLHKDAAFLYKTHLDVN